jgi:Tol biopolymer transport system component
MVGSRPASTPFQAMQIDRLTLTGTVRDVAISPDGKYVAYVQDENGEQSLWLRQAATGSSVQIVPTNGQDFVGVTFSPDGNFIDYVRFEKQPVGYSALYQVPALGGEPKRLVYDIDTAVSFSPDGKQFAFVRGDPSHGQTHLMIANSDGSNVHALASRPFPGFTIGLSGGPAWSPDGKVIAAAAMVSGTQFDAVIVSVADGAQKPLTGRSWARVGRMAWTPDGSSLILTASTQQAPGASRQIWQISYPSGAGRRVTNDLNNYAGISLTSDGSGLVTVLTNTSANLWVAPKGNAADARQITSSAASDAGLGGVSWSGEDKLIFTSSAGNQGGLWSVSPNAGVPTRFTSDSNAFLWPSACGRSGYIVFSSGRSGSLNIWRIDESGGNFKKLTDGKTDALPACTPDGRWVYYVSISAGPPQLWKVSIDGGAPTQVSKEISMEPRVSPDGKWLAVMSSTTKGGRVIQEIDFLTLTGEKVKQIPYPANAPPQVQYSWSPDSKMLDYIATTKGVSNIWGMPIDNGKPRQVTDFKSEQIYNFAWSQKGDLAVSRGTQSSDAVMIRKFQ